MSANKRTNEDLGCLGPIDGKRSRFSSSTIERSDLELFGVFYATKPLPVSDLLQKLKEKKGRTQFPLPERAQYFVKETKERLTFSLDINEILADKEESLHDFQVKETLEYLEDQEREIQKYRNEIRKSNYLEDPLNNVLFNEWISSIVKFVQLVEVMVRLLSCPRHEEPHWVKDGQKQKPEKGIYQDVFSRFSEIFFLLPATGRKRNLNLQDKTFTCVPDLGFYEYTARGSYPPLLVTCCEVKRESQATDFDESRSWISQILNDHVLGQVGTELLAGCLSSTFLPNVLGVILMRTEVMFAFLDIETDHYQAICDNKDTSGRRAIIHYTKTFDMSKPEGRNEIVDLMFWLGCVQKGNYFRFYLKQ